MSRPGHVDLATWSHQQIRDEAHRCGLSTNVSRAKMQTQIEKSVCVAQNVSQDIIAALQAMTPVEPGSKYSKKKRYIFLSACWFLGYFLVQSYLAFWLVEPVVSVVVRRLNENGDMDGLAFRIIELRGMYARWKWIYPLLVLVFNGWKFWLSSQANDMMHWIEHAPLFDFLACFLWYCSLARRLVSLIWSWHVICHKNSEGTGATETEDRSSGELTTYETELWRSRVAALFMPHFTDVPDIPADVSSLSQSRPFQSCIISYQEWHRRQEATVSKVFVGLIYMILQRDYLYHIHVKGSQRVVPSREEQDISTLRHKSELVNYQSNPRRYVLTVRALQVTVDRLQKSFEQSKAWKKAVAEQNMVMCAEASRLKQAVEMYSGHFKTITELLDSTLDRLRSNMEDYHKLNQYVRAEHVRLCDRIQDASSLDQKRILSETSRPSSPQIDSQIDAQEEVQQLRVRLEMLQSHYDTNFTEWCDETVLLGHANHRLYNHYQALLHEKKSIEEMYLTDCQRLGEKLDATKISGFPI